MNIYNNNIILCYNIITILFIYYIHFAINRTQMFKRK